MLAKEKKKKSPDREKWYARMGFFLKQEGGTVGFAEEQGMEGRYWMGPALVKWLLICTFSAKPGLKCLTSTIPVRTVKGVQVNGEAIGLPEALATVPADVWLVPSVGPHVAGQFNGLGKHSITVLARVHLPCTHMSLWDRALSIYLIFTDKIKF
jgi:hypothetical protein